MARDIGYHKAHSALVLTETCPTAFPDSWDCDDKEAAARQMLAVVTKSPERFSRVEHHSTMEGSCVWKDSVLFIIIDGVTPDVEEESHHTWAARGDGVGDVPPTTAPDVPGEVRHESKTEDGPGSQSRSFRDMLEGNIVFNCLGPVELRGRRNLPAAPKHRRFERGVNYECACLNARCDAFYTQVIIPRGMTREGGVRPFEEVYFMRGVLCPLCKEPVASMSSFGFSDCDFVWRGVDSDGQRREYLGTAPPSRYVPYTDTLLGAALDAMNWSVLIVRTTPSRESIRVGAAPTNREGLINRED